MALTSGNRICSGYVKYGTYQGARVDFYFMFQLQPVGSAAHVQVCGTLSCMLCGAEDLIEVCKEKISPTAHTVSKDGKLSWKEVECLGACATLRWHK